MQDLRSIGAGNGRIFGTGVDRRMRAAHPQQPLKCPRCDSLNTKFCYYNNYNLSQPRHFCKSCRRYWTKGGVLRNVPVGGGCRKPKRSSKPKPSSSSPPPPPPHRDRNSASHSSSESSTLTGATTTNTPPPVVAAAAVATPAAEVASAPSTVLNYVNPAAAAAFEAMGNFSKQASDPAGSFTSLMTGSNPGVLGFGFGDLAGNATFPFEFQQQKMVEEMKMQDLTFLDQTAVQQQQQLGENRGSNEGGLTALEWQSNVDQQGLFDLTAEVVLDQGYWSITTNTQWADNDPALFLP